jgi:tetratricopeptide (TPR) repeat protein
MSFDFLDHFPDEEDESNVKSYGYLTRQLPDSNNYDKYYSLACSLWELNSLTKAEKMFLNIINSNEKYYSTTYDHSSDIPGDFSSALYGYGHFSSNYKNSAAIHLAKIYIEKKEFDKALSFLEDAIKKYEVSYSCGTGYRNQQDEYNFLYGCIYEGQKDYDKVMDLLLPECLTRNDEIIVRVIKKKYSREEIKEKLQLAENSIQCEFDTEPSFTYRTVGVNAERLIR